MKKIGRILLLIFTGLMVSGCSRKPIEIYTLDDHGNYVNDNFKIKYNEQNDIAMIDSGDAEEYFFYQYDENGNVTNVAIEFVNGAILHAEFDIEYYDNGEIFSIRMNNNDGFETEQYFLYNDEDQLKHLVNTTTWEDGSVLSKYIVEFDYHYHHDGKEYVIEKTYNASTGIFSSGRIYTKSSIENPSNNLEKIGIVTELMYENEYRKINRGGQLPNVYQMPIGMFFYSNRISTWVSNNKYMSNIYDEEGNYVITANVPSVSALYKEEDAYIREEILSDNIHYTYKYISQDNQFVKLEVYEEKPNETKLNQLKSKYIGDSSAYTNTSPVDQLVKYSNTKINNVDAYYRAYMKTIKANGNIYDKYKKNKS